MTLVDAIVSQVLAPRSASQDTRRQDRKILLEVITNEEYWQRIETQ